MQNRITLIISLLLLGLVSGCSNAEPTSAPPEATATIAPAPAPVAETPLPDLSVLQLEGKWNTQRHTTIELKELRGDVLVVVMIYTSCKAACPRLVADMRAISRKVEAKKTGGVRYVLVSIDPEVDTADRLAAFAKEAEMEDPKWLFLQGTEESVRDFANVLAVKYKEISPIDFSHSNIISVFDTDGVLVHQQEGLSVNNDKTVETIIGLASKGR